MADLDSTALCGDLVSGIGTTDIRLEVRRYGSEADLRDAVERGYVEFGLLIPAGYEAGRARRAFDTRFRGFL